MRLKNFGILLLMTAGMMRGQNALLDPITPLGSNTNGLRLYGVTVGSYYYSGGYGSGTGVPVVTPANSQIMAVQGSASMGWSRRKPRSSFSIVYSPSYVRSMHLFEYTSTNHALSAGFNKALGGRWNLDVSLSGLVSDFNQLLFAPTQYGGLASAPATFDELAATFLTGTSGNSGLTSLINTAQTVGTPELGYLYGSRVFSASAQAGISYRLSARSTFHAGIQGIRTEGLQQSGNAGVTGPAYAVPKTVAGTASLGWSYAVTPRTHTSFNVSSGRTFSKFLDAYNTHASVSVGRTLSRRWFAQGGGGMGIITPIRESVLVSRNAQYEVSGGVGFKTSAHTFLGSYSRSISDIYGLGANSTESGTGAWTWKSRGQGVSISSTVGYSKLNGQTFQNPGSVRASLSVSKALNAHMFMSASYSYVRYPASLTLLLPESSQNGVVVSVNWSPAGGR